jgi:hypothetical protein
MYASMPFLLEEAVVEVYLDKGWELATSTNSYIDVENCGDEFYDYLPTLEDLLQKIDVVVQRKQYAQELSMDLSAALKARLSSLLTGSKGLMLNTRRSTPLGELMQEQVILELKYVGDDDEKCFLMGLILSSIYEYLEVHHEAEKDLRHVLLIEEAHRLLKRTPDFSAMESSNPRGKAVETFTNIISEIRAYGEGVIIDDQIPAKLAPDVVKNTNLKIVHRTLAKDDRDYVGATMRLIPEQNDELPLLKVGQAVCHREGWDKPFLIQIPEVKDSCGHEVDNNRVKEAMSPYHAEHIQVFRRLPGFEKDPRIPNAFSRLDFRRFDASIYQGVIALAVLGVVGDYESVTTTGLRLRNLISRHTKDTEALMQDCRYIWYVNRFISKLNEAYHSNYKVALQAHQALIDLWFTDNPEVIGPASMKLRQSLEIIVDGGHPLDPMTSWYADNSNAVSTLSNTLKNDTWSENYQKLDAYLIKAAKNIVIDANINDYDLCIIKQCILRSILRGNPNAALIMSHYRKTYCKERKSI